MLSRELAHAQRHGARDRVSRQLVAALGYQVSHPPGDTAASSLRSATSFGLVPMCLQPGSTLLPHRKTVIMSCAPSRVLHEYAATCRVLALVGEGRLDPGRAGGDEVYRLTRRAAPWASLLGPGQTIGVEARVHGCTNVPSALLARARVRDAVCDSVSDARCGTAPLARAWYSLVTWSHRSKYVTATGCCRLMCLSLYDAPCGVSSCAVEAVHVNSSCVRLGVDWSRIRR